MIYLNFGGFDFYHSKYRSFDAKKSFGRQINIGVSFGIGSFSKKKSTAKLINNE